MDPCPGKEVVAFHTTSYCLFHGSWRRPVQTPAANKEAPPPSVMRCQLVLPAVARLRHSMPAARGPAFPVYLSSQYLLFVC